nr:hypothetical protein [uncultured Clostridium sp.]
MQISDIKRELERILLTCHELDMSDTVDYYEKSFFDEDILLVLTECQKNLNAVRKDLKSSLAKYWSNELLTALKQYNKITSPKKEKTTKIQDDTIDFNNLYDNKKTNNSPNAFFKIIDPYSEPTYSMKQNISIEGAFRKATSVYMYLQATVKSLEICEDDTLTPLPSNIAIDKEALHNLRIRTYSQYENLLYLDEDLHRLHEIIELLSYVQKKEPIDFEDDNASPNYFIRRLTTGSFELFLSTALPAASAIAGFIFLIIKECQMAKERQISTKLKEKELSQNEMKITSQIINDAAKILSVDPENEVYRKMINQAGIQTLNYLQHNLHGSINGEEYRIPETPTLKIEEIALEIEKSTDNGEE